jgi:hypothetical protein
MKKAFEQTAVFGMRHDLKFFFVRLALGHA